MLETATAATVLRLIKERRVKPPFVDEFVIMVSAFYLRPLIEQTASERQEFFSNVRKCLRRMWSRQMAQHAQARPDERRAQADEPRRIAVGRSGIRCSKNIRISGTHHAPADSAQPASDSVSALRRGSAESETRA